MNEEVQPCETAMSFRTLTEGHGSASCNLSCRFCRNVFHSHSSTAPVFSVTQSKGYKGLQLSAVLSGFGIYLEKDLVSSGSFLQCLFLLQLFHRIGLNCSISSVRVLQNSTIISGHLPARQITRTSRSLYTATKKVNRLPALVDNPHLKKQRKFVQRGSRIHKSKGKFITVSFSAMQAVVCD